MKWGVICQRLPASVFGAAREWLTKDGKIYEGTELEAKAQAEEWNRKKRTAQVRYMAVPRG